MTVRSVFIGLPRDEFRGIVTYALLAPLVSRSQAWIVFVELVYKKLLLPLYYISCRFVWRFQKILCASWNSSFITPLQMCFFISREIPQSIVFLLLETIYVSRWCFLWFSQTTRWILLFFHLFFLSQIFFQRLPKGFCFVRLSGLKQIVVVIDCIVVSKIECGLFGIGSILDYGGNRGEFCSIVLSPAFVQKLLDWIFFSYVKGSLLLLLLLYAGNEYKMAGRQEGGNDGHTVDQGEDIRLDASPFPAGTRVAFIAAHGSCCVGSM